MKKLIVCRKCSSSHYVKAGKTHGGKQQYKCLDCSYRYIRWNPFYRRRYPKKIIAQAVYLYQTNLSLRMVARFILNNYGLSVTYRTIKNWIEKFSHTIQEYILKFKYGFSGLWHFDEFFITWDIRDPKNKHKMIKREYHYCWNCLDAESRFLVPFIFALERTTPYAIKIMERTIAIAKAPPQQIVSDALSAYPIAIQKVIIPHNKFLKHTRFVMIKGERGNNRIERANGTLRTRVRLYRGYRPKGNSAKMFNMFVLFYNFLRPHSSLMNKTPAEKVGVDLKLEHNQNGLLKLFQLASYDAHRIALKGGKSTFSAI